MLPERWQEQILLHLHKRRAFHRRKEQGSVSPHKRAVLGHRYELLKALGFPIGWRGDKRVSAVCN